MVLKPIRGFHIYFIVSTEDLHTREMHLLMPLLPGFISHFIFISFDYIEHIYFLGNLTDGIHYI